MGYFGAGKELRFDSPLFPGEGWSEDEVMAQLNEFEAQDAAKVGRHSMIYGVQLMNHMDATRISRAAYAMFLKKNMLYKELQPGTERMTLELKQMIIEGLNHPHGARVRLTSGGSESLYCGINSAYQWFRQQKPRVREPEIVVPYTIHGAVSKWCHFTGIKLKRVPLGPDYRADVPAMEKAITKNTFLVAGSAPCWPYGLYDDIEGLGAVAQRHGIWMHVDGCLGGFLAPFVEKAGHRLPPWAFNVPGVRSISADLHKFGFASKPLSSISYRSEEWEQYHEYAPADWPDGPYSTEAMYGSTTAGPVASAWAVMRFLGESGYVELARRFLANKKRYIEGINSIDGLRCWENDLTPLPFELPKGMDIFAVLGGCFERNVYCLPGFQPPLIKVLVDPVTEDVVERFIEVLREVVPLVKKGDITIENLRPYL